MIQVYDFGTRPFKKRFIIWTWFSANKNEKKNDKWKLYITYRMIFKVICPYKYVILINLRCKFNSEMNLIIFDECTFDIFYTGVEMYEHGFPSLIIYTHNSFLN